MAEIRSTEGVFLLKIWTTDSIADGTDFMKPISNVGHQFWDAQLRSKRWKGILNVYSTLQIYPRTVEDSPQPLVAPSALPRRCPGWRSPSLIGTSFGEGFMMRFDLERSGGIKDPYRGLLRVGESVWRAGGGGVSAPQSGDYAGDIPVVLQPRKGVG
jgi:hypothetical protein